MKPLKNLEQYQAQYELEKKLAEQLKRATKTERETLYGQIYDEFFQFTLQHPDIFPKDNSQTNPSQKWQLVGRYTDQNTELLEIGAGNFTFTTFAASRVKKVYALETSSGLKQKYSDLLKNVVVLVSSTSLIPLPDNAVDVIYSNQVIEHLHPDDAAEALEEMHRVLKKNGVFICMTPNRLSGPHDISKYFNKVANGLHLKEYTIKELSHLLQQTGFSQIKVYAGGKGIYLSLPLRILIIIEAVLKWLPSGLTLSLARSYLGRALLGITMVGIKK